MIYVDKPTWAVHGRGMSSMSAQSPIAKTSPFGVSQTRKFISVRTWEYTSYRTDMYVLQEEMTNEESSNYPPLHHLPHSSLLPKNESTGNSVYLIVDSWSLSETIAYSHTYIIVLCHWNIGILVMSMPLNSSQSVDM